MKRRLCQHPLNDEVVLVHTVKTRDLMDGKENATYGYYCRTHRRMGHWKVVTPIAIPGAIREILEEVTPFDDI